jgi:hypothetical protein
MATVVHQFRIRSAHRDKQALAARVATQLNAADLSPSALPQGAWLVVRRLGSGLPPWRIDPRSVRPPADWQTALSQKLDEVLRRAVRARRGAIPEDADAILFFDEAEMLSQMSLDWMAGTLHSHWCWRTLFPRGDLVDTMLRAWVEHPECVPAAIARLAEERRAGTFVQRLPEPVLETLVHGVIRVFSLRHLEPVLEAVFREVPRPVSAEPPSARVDSLAGVPAGSVDPPPVSIPGSVSQIGAKPPLCTTPEMRRAFFLELAAELYRAPQVVRTQQWAERLQTSAASLAFTEFTRPATPLALPDAEAPLPKMARPKSEFGQNPPSQIWQVVEQAPPTQEPSKDCGQFTQNPTQPFPVSVPFTLPELAEGIEIQTAFAGIFYLINLALYLGYYGDFSTPEQPGIDLPLWDFLAQIGRELAGKPLFEDPVWPFIKDLADAPPWEELEPAMLRIRKWLAETFPERDDPAAFVLRHTARVRLTDTRLDSFLSLQELPIGIRLARLDRDPGWIPAAGRFIAFHFL